MNLTDTFIQSNFEKINNKGKNHAHSLYHTKIKCKKHKNVIVKFSVFIKPVIYFYFLCGTVFNF